MTLSVNDMIENLIHVMSVIKPESKFRIRMRTDVFRALNPENYQTNTLNHLDVLVILDDEIQEIRVDEKFQSDIFVEELW